jgi:hypothetical protein
LDFVPDHELVVGDEFELWREPIELLSLPQSEEDTEEEGGDDKGGTALLMVGSSNVLVGESTEE